MAKMLTAILLVNVLAGFAAGTETETEKKDYFDALEMLGVNFAIPSDAWVNVPNLSRQAADMGVVRIKLFDYQNRTIYNLRKYYSFAGRKLEIMVALPQWLAKPPTGKGKQDEKAIQDLITTMRYHNDIIKGVFVYNEPCLNNYCTGQNGEEYLQLMDRLAEELKDEGFMVATPFSMGGILANTFPPENSVFSQNHDFMVRLLNILKKTNAPIYANLYPYLDFCYDHNVLLNWAMGSEQVNGPTMDYIQIDADIKALHAALQKMGPEFASHRVAIGETGWAHHFGPKPTWAPEQMRAWSISQWDYANTFYSNIANRLQGWAWAAENLYSIYIFDLADEPKKESHAPAYNGEKYFGISGLYKNTSKAPWNRDQPSNHKKGAAFAKMRPQDWADFHAEQGNFKWIQTAQPENAGWAAAQLKYDQQAAKEYLEQLQAQGEIVCLDVKTLGMGDCTTTTTTASFGEYVSDLEDEWDATSPPSSSRNLPAIALGAVGLAVVAAAAASVHGLVRRRRQASELQSLVEMEAACPE